MAASPSLERSPQAKRLVVWLIWFSLLMAVVIYGVVGTLARDETAPDTATGGGTGLTSLLVLVSTVQLAAGFVLRFLFISRPALAGELDLESAGGFQRYLTVQIVIFALTEAVAIYGLLLFFTGDIPPATFHRFLIAAGTGLLLHAPIQSGSDSPRPPEAR